MPAQIDKLKLATNVGRSGTFLCLARVPNTSRLFAGSSDATVCETDFAAEKPQLLPHAGHTSYVTGVAVAGKWVVSGGYDRKLIWRELDGGKIVRSIDAHTKWLRGVTTSPDCAVVASFADDMVCRLWDAASGKQIHELRGHAEKTPQHFASMLHAAAFSPDGKLLATADKPGKIVIWEVSTGKQAATFDSPEHYTWDPKQRRHSIGGVRCLAFSPDGKQLAVGGVATIENIDGLGGKALVQLFEWQTGKKQFAFEHPRHKGLVNQLSYAPDGAWLIAAGGGGGGFFFFLDPKTNKALHDEDAKMHIHGLAMSESGETVFVAGQGAVARWEMKG